MKIKILNIGICLIFLSLIGCKDCNDCEKQLKETKSELSIAKDSLGDYKDHLLEIKQLNYALYPQPENGNIKQEYSDITEISNRSTERYKVYGSFDLSNDQVSVNIPVTEKKLRIIYYQSISTPDINTLLIVLDGNNGQLTKSSPIVGILTKTFSIDSLGLKRTELINDKKLKVIVFHDNNYLNMHAEIYYKCLLSLGKDQYDDTCNDIVKIAKEINAPKENGGGILTGG